MSYDRLAAIEICKSKNWFDSQVEAELVGIARRQRPYTCTICNLWHLTSQLQPRTEDHYDLLAKEIRYRFDSANPDWANRNPEQLRLVLKKP